MGYEEDLIAWAKEAIRMLLNSKKREEIEGWLNEQGSLGKFYELMGEWRKLIVDEEGNPRSLWKEDPKRAVQRAAEELHEIFQTCGICQFVDVKGKRTSAKAVRVRGAEDIFRLMEELAGTYSPRSGGEEGT